MRFLSFLSITILLLGCKYSCDGNFKDIYSSYNFYELNDSIKFYNHTDTIKFEVIESEYDEPSSFRGIAMDVECVYQSFFKTNKIQNDYQLNIEYGGGVTHIKITEHDEFDLLKYKRNIIANGLITFEYNSVYFQDSIQHLEVFSIVKDTINENPKIGGITWSSNSGLIAFYDFEQKINWKIVND